MIVHNQAGVPLRVLPKLAPVTKFLEIFGPDPADESVAWKGWVMGRIGLTQGKEVTLSQEVQGDHFKSFLEPELRKLGYEGVYKQKTRESMGEEGKMDGGSGGESV